MIKTCAAVTLLLGATVGTSAMSDDDIPMEAVDDAVMAGADEVKAIQDWAASPGGKMSGPLPLTGEPPFSFIYDGKPSAELLKSWPRTTEIRQSPDRIEHRFQWSDPKTGLQVLLVAGAFKRFPAVDWVVEIIFHEHVL